MSDFSNLYKKASDLNRVDLLPGLWEEYRYRHDMIWKLVFRSQPLLLP